MLKKFDYKRIILFVIWFILLIPFLVLIAYSVRWMSANYGSVTGFGDSKEYLKLSQSFKIDEYRTIFFPLLVRFCTSLENIFHIPYQIFLYVLQLLLNYCGISYAWLTIKEQMNWKKWEWQDEIIKLYILCIPMITFLNFSVLTDSIALAMLFFIIASVVRLSYKAEKRDYVILGVSFGIGALIRADRMYSCLVYLLIYLLIIKIIKQGDNELRKRILTIVGIVICICAMVVGINQLTQKPGSHGRVKTDFAFVLLDRIVWPNMTANYESFSERVKDVISIEMAQNFDEHNNNVMYKLAPKVEKKVGEKEADQIYIEMAKVVFHNQTKKVLWDITEDFLRFLFAPESSWLAAQGKIITNYGWNISCASLISPEYTNSYIGFYNKWFGRWNFLRLLLFSIVGILIDKSGNVKKMLGLITPYLGMGIIISLWFSIGDGAPPNDRYVLICHAAWGMLLCGFWQCIQYGMKKGE